MPIDAGAQRFVRPATCRSRSPPLEGLRLLPALSKSRRQVAALSGSYTRKRTARHTNPHVSEVGRINDGTVGCPSVSGDASFSLIHESRSENREMCQLKFKADIWVNVGSDFPPICCSKVAQRHTKGRGGEEGNYFPPGRSGLLSHCRPLTHRPQQRQQFDCAGQIRDLRKNRSQGDSLRRPSDFAS